MGKADRPLLKLFGLIAEYATASGAASIKDLPGCWEAQVDDAWWLALNGHDTPTRCSHGPEVGPFEAYVEHHGWPAGTMSPFEGVIAAGEGANERTFAAALEAATRAKGGGHGGHHGAAHGSVPARGDQAAGRGAWAQTRLC